MHALRGANWLVTGWRLFCAAPLGWLAVVFVYWVVMMLVSLLPFGIAAAPLLVPAFSVGFMAAGRAAARGAPVELAQLFEAFRGRLKPQLALGASTSRASPRCSGRAGCWTRARWREVLVSPRAELQPGMRGTLAIVMLLYVPVIMAFWFSPVLVAWHNAGVAKSLFFSFAACLINWRAFLVYGALTLLAPALALLVLAQALGAAALRALALPLMIFVLPTLLASFYASYRDVFAPETAA